jgi:glycosyltransferase involved in cell wall biosynthesis
VTDRLVDVIIPTRNRYEELAEAIDSVCEQTISSWRLIIVDDASDNGSLEKVQRLTAGDRRITIIARPQRGGEQAARQTGFEFAEAPYIATLDSDDLWLSPKLEKQVSCFASERESLPQLGAVLSWHQWIDVRPGGRLTKPVSKPTAHGWLDPLAYDNMSAIMVRREAIEAAGGYLPTSVRSLATCANQEFYIRLTKHCQFAVVAEKLVVCRRTLGYQSGIDYGGRRAAEEMEYLKALHADRLSQYPHQLATLEAWIGTRYLNSGFRQKGLGHLLAALRGAGPGQALELLRTYGPFAGKATIKKRKPPSWAIQDTERLWDDVNTLPEGEPKETVQRGTL